MRSRKKQYLTHAQVRERYGNRSHMWVPRKLKTDPRFPKPVKFGRWLYFDLDELEAYERACASGEAA